MKIKLKTDLCVCGKRSIIFTGTIVECTRQDKKNYYFKTKNGEDYPKVKEIKVPKTLAEPLKNLKHIEITEKGKILFSADVNDFNLSQHRDATAIYKKGESKTYMLAPSRITQTIISFEEYTVDNNSEYSTQSRVVNLNDKASEIQKLNNNIYEMQTKHYSKTKCIIPRHIMSFPKGADNGTLGPED